MTLNNRIAQNLKLFSVVLLGLLLVSEFLLRACGTELRLWSNDLTRKKKISAKRGEFENAAKSAGVSAQTFNIYYLGESTMWGVPYGPPASIPDMVDYRLGGSLGAKPVRSVNLGSAAKDAAYVRYAAELILRERDVFHPSLIVIYSGHNEFLKFHPTEPDLEHPAVLWLVEHSELARQLLTVLSRHYGGEILETGRRRFWDRSIFPFDRKGFDKVIAHYRRHLLAIVKRAEKSEVPLVLSTVVSNYAGWEPNRSVYCSSSRAKAHKDAFQQAFERGKSAEKRRDFGPARGSYEEALSICSSFAEVYFRLGKVYQALQKNDLAWEAFQKAIDYDGMPVRGLARQNEFIRSLERFDHVHAVDSLALLRGKAPNGLLDERFIIDGVHPNWEGYLFIGEAIANQIHALCSTGGEHLKSLDLETAKNVFGVNSSKMFGVYYETGRWMARLSTWRYDPAQRLEAAETFFRQAVEIDPNRYEGFLGLAVAALLKGNPEDAEGFLQKARSRDVKRVEEYLEIPWIQKIARRAHLNASAVPSPV